MADPLPRLLPALAQVPGVAAVVLGGSRARGTELPGSDHDVGLYYEPGAPIDLAALRTALAPLTDAPPELTEPGAWGPWINGGGWLSVGGQRVDLLYRDLAALRACLDQARAGVLTCHIQPGHPFGVTNALWLGEVAVARVLHDPGGVVGALKTQVLPMPAALRAALVQRFHWEAGFAIASGAKAVPRGDTTHVAGAAYRALGCLAQVLFALNGRYLVNEKGALAEAACLPLTLAELAPRVQAVWAAVGQGALQGALDRLSALEADLGIIVKGNPC